MRPPAENQNPLRTPLNHLLGTEGNVRILRVLCETQSPIARTRVAEHARLNPSGVRRSLDRLAEYGIIEVVGSGRNQSVTLRRDHPLAEQLCSLYRSERETYELLTSTIQEAAGEMEENPTAIWVERPSSASPGMIDIGFLASARDIDAIREQLLNALETLEEDLAVHFVVRGYARADLLVESEEFRSRLEEVVLIYGWIPVAWRKGTGAPIGSHQGLDARAQVLARKVSELLPNDPSIIERALRWIEERERREGTSTVRDLQEWRRILSDLSLPQVQALLMEESERADRLRQSFPFVEALTPEERNEIFKGGTA